VESFLVLEFDPTVMFLSEDSKSCQVGALGDRISNCSYDLRWGSLWIDEIHHGGQGSSRPTLQFHFKCLSRIIEDRREYSYSITV
jgi:hypothetical protein